MHIVALDKTTGQWWKAKTRHTTVFHHPNDEIIILSGRRRGKTTSLLLVSYLLQKALGASRSSKIVVFGGVNGIRAAIHLFGGEVTAEDAPRICQKGGIEALRRRDSRV